MKASTQTVNVKNILRHASRMWVVFFPYIVGVLMIGMFIYLSLIGYRALYRSDISSEDLASELIRTQKKNAFKTEQFASIVTNIAQREVLRKKRSETVPDIFYRNNMPREKK